MNIPNNQVLRQVSDFDCECGDDFKQPFKQTDIPKYGWNFLFWEVIS